MKETPATRPVMGNIPSEEELHRVLEEHHNHDEAAFNYHGNYPFVKLFLAICLSAPVAAFLATKVIANFGANPGAIAPSINAQAGGEDLSALIASQEKSNIKIAEAIGAQTSALEKLTAAVSATLATKAPEPAADGSEPTKAMEKTKVILVKAPTQEPFDLGYEKIKILDLCGVDLDDPISGPEAFSKIDNVEIIKEVIHSFDIILASSKDNKEVSAFIKGNALKGRKFAIEQLKKIK